VTGKSLTDNSGGAKSEEIKSRAKKIRRGWGTAVAGGVERTLTEHNIELCKTHHL